MQLYDVIIIGAGVAGLTAARELQAQGKSVVVLEAQDYVGGRVKSFDGWGVPLELGAEFIHGSDTITASIARDLGLEIVSAYQDHKLINEDGRSLLPEQKETYKRLLRYVALHGKQGVSIQEVINGNPVTKDSTLMKLVAVAAGDFEAGDANMLDSGAYTEMMTRTAHNGKNLLLKQGYGDIVSYLSDGIDIKLVAIVTKIKYAKTPVVVDLNDGSTMYAKKVIITVSLGVLKSNYIEFAPALPEVKQRAIQKLGMGNSIKFLLRLKDPQDVHELFQYADGDNGALQTITCWWASASDPHVLVGFCGGSRADAVIDLDEDRLLEKVIQDLSRVLGRDLRHEIAGSRLVRWDDNPFVRGSYSNHPVSTVNAEREALGDPTAGRLFWAGEATVSDGNYGTVHGAISSGYRVVRQMI